MAELRTGTGTFRVADGTLHIERPDSRIGLLRMLLRRYTEQHPGRTAAYVSAACVLSLLALTVLQVYALGVAATIESWRGIVQIVAFPASVLLLTAIGVGFGGGLLTRRRARQREGIETFDHPERILLDDVANVISASFAGIGALYVVYQDSGEKVAVPIAFMPGMKNELEGAKELFRNRGIPLESGT